MSTRRPTPSEACAAIAAEHAAGVRAELEARTQIGSLADELARYGTALSELPDEIEQQDESREGSR